MLCGFSVVLGAFGSHVLTDLLSALKLQTFNKASYYLMVHCIAVILLLVVKNTTNLHISIHSIKALLIGALIFSICLYAVSFSEIQNLTFLKYFGMLAPVGGLTMIVSWFILALGILKSPRQ